MTNSTMTRTDLINKATETIDFYTEMGNEVFAIQMPMPKLDFSLRGTCGGKYSPRLHTVKVNLVLFKENFEDYIENTLPHELAHAITRHKFDTEYSRVKPHGPEWKRVMRALGKAPTRCHSYDTSNARVRRVRKGYEYSCACKTYSLTIIRHRRAQKAMGSGYRCRKCGQSLRYVGHESAVAVA